MTLKNHSGLVVLHTTFNPQVILVITALLLVWDFPRGFLWVLNVLVAPNIRNTYKRTKFSVEDTLIGEYTVFFFKKRGTYSNDRVLSATRCRSSPRKLSLITQLYDLYPL